MITIVNSKFVKVMSVVITSAPILSFFNVKIILICKIPKCGNYCSSPHHEDNIPSSNCNLLLRFRPDFTA